MEAELRIEILHHLKLGKKIDAIRAYRDQMGGSLVQAKHVVDALYYEITESKDLTLRDHKIEFNRLVAVSGKSKTEVLESSRLEIGDPDNDWFDYPGLFRVFNALLLAYLEHILSE